MADPVVIHQHLTAGLGNMMFQHMFAVALARRVPGAVLTGKPLRDWGIRPPVLPLPARHLKVVGHKLNLDRLAYVLRTGLVQGVETNALGMRMELLDPLEEVRNLFRAGPCRDPGFGPEDLVINVRGAEIIGGVHKDYRPLPIAFYARLVAETGRHPVFLGQLGEDAYSSALRTRFPDATFLPSRGAMEDFAALRAARHLVVSISSFSWLAAWLSEAETIHLPLAGMFHPQQRPDVDLLPVSDARYRFHRFPVAPWTATPEEMDLLLAGPEAGQAIAAEEALRLVCHELSA
ncbi:hypothetical protein [Falsiroseomonas sp.]|uniref:hypothetical protein n=1 Tax=Falsiroseomonas sp. TaxID=2870721 RepID=UPI003F72D147